MAVVSDPISDMLTRIRNGGRAIHPTVTMPSSKMKVAVAKVLQQEGYIEQYALDGSQPQPNLQLSLKYLDKEPVIAGLRRISKPSRRVFVGVRDIPRVIGGLGVAILSTPMGIMTGKEAKKNNVGGEVLCYIW